ncbi:MAG: ANTAR domain-containing protein [Treponema sp.]|jgi:response regulator NasT|nr:ANTAR domain-containing protein [Treponema sp.]
MDNVLIVSNTSATLGIVSDLLKSQTFARIVATQNGSESRRALINDDFELVIIDTPLPDEYGDDFALHAAESTSAGIILITKTETLYDMNEAVEDAGVFVLPKPISPDFFLQAVKLLYASRKRVLKLQDENKTLQNKLQEIRIVDRAKCVLIQYLNMTEMQAHRYIEKQAMDLRQSRAITAENILKTYDNNAGSAW